MQHNEAASWSAAATAASQGDNLSVSRVVEGLGGASLLRWSLCAAALLLSTSAHAQSVIWENIGPQNANGFTLFPGLIFDSRHDVNGDGVNDVVAGAGGKQLSGIGELYVFNGKDGSTLYTIPGSDPGALFGFLSHLVGDLDGDGSSEFASTVDRLGDLPGIHFYSGASGAEVEYFPSPFPTSDLYTYILAEIEVNGDGVGDYLIGDPTTDPGGVINAGSAAVLSGVDGSVIWSVDGTGTYNRLGWSGANVGDFDSDGIDDVLIGAPGYIDVNDFNELSESYAELLSGATGILIHRFEGNPPGQYNRRLGWSVDGGGDVNEDGVNDLLIGSSYNTLIKPPGVEAFSGVDFSLLFSTSNLDGSSARFLGDVDGDGYGDFLGANVFECLDEQWPYSSCGAVFVYSGKDGSLTFKLQKFWGARFGNYTVSPGDIDGDDFPELLVGDDQYTQTSTQPWQGRLTMLSLRPHGVEVFGQACPTSLGSLPRIGITGSARIGHDAAVHVSRVAEGVKAWLFMGLSNSSWNGYRLPLSLDFLGLPGCELLTAVDVACVTTTARVGKTGVGSVSVPIPRDRSLVDVTFFAQWIVMNPPGSPSFAALTRGLEITILEDVQRYIGAQ